MDQIQRVAQQMAVQEEQNTQMVRQLTQTAQQDLQILQQAAQTCQQDLQRFQQLIQTAQQDIQILQQLGQREVVAANNARFIQQQAQQLGQVMAQGTTGYGTQALGGYYGGQ